MTKAEELLEVEKCRRWPHYFVFDSHHVLTKNEHDSANPVAPFPDLGYLRVLLDCLLVSGKIVRPLEARYALAADVSEEFLAASYDLGMFMVEKSRQIMFTWVTCAYLLWRAKFREHQLLIVQSKREEDAAKLVCWSKQEATEARINFMEENLPSYLQTLSTATYCHLHFQNGSHIWAIPEGGEMIRSNTPSVLFSDEAAFQPEFGGAYRAAIPAVEGGGQLICGSSANPGEYCDVIEAAA